MTTQENWLPVMDWPGYEVSDSGRVRSYWHRVGWRVFSILHGCDPTIIKGSFGQGYPKVRLSNPNEARHTYTYIHIMVLEAFVGRCPEGLECCHENGRPSDARLANLRWDTPKANQFDKVKHGTYVAGCSHHLAKLAEQQIGEIVALSLSGVSQRKIGERFGIDQSTVCRILKGSRYRQEMSKLVERQAA